MRCALPAVAIVSLALAAPVSAAEYWPMTPGVTYVYHDEQARTVTVSYGGGVRYLDYGTGCMEETALQENGDGDVTMRLTDYYCRGAIDPDFVWQFDPPAVFLDLPLTVGKSWTVADVGYYGHPCSRPARYEIVGEEQVTVPAGTFDTFVLRETDESGQRTYYLDRALGAVRITQLCQGYYALGGTLDLVGVEGPTPTRPKTWGMLKMLYR